MWSLRSCTPADSAVRRLRHVHNVLSRAYCSSNAGTHTGPDTESVSIGDASVPIAPPSKPELVPTRHLPIEPGQTVLGHLRWIMQKDVLGQDVFLIGPPGPLRRHLAMQYCELTQREVEYVSLSRDTTESDLKQRREIQGGTAFYVDQAAVRAALEGRVLILDGIEKAERNVLPVLNNLLENREMQLEDGCFLIPAARYDALVKSTSQSELDTWKLKRVSERFRVIALGLPVPRYKGNPLDPPLRSRFQGRDVRHVAYADALALMQQMAPNAPAEKLSALLSVASTIASSEGKTLGLPDFPLDSITDLAVMLNRAPRMPISVLLQILYPSVILNAEAQKSYSACLEHFSVKELHADQHPYSSYSLSVSAPSKTVESADGGPTVRVQLSTQDGSRAEFTAPAGCLPEATQVEEFVETEFHRGLIARLLLGHSVGDMCIVGPKGCGKTAVARHFGSILQYTSECVLLYQDMTARDLLQQRMTLPNGDTSWRPSPLVTAALNGNLAVLDGLHRVNAGTLAVLHRLLRDRELSLYDGTKLLRRDRYEHLKEQLGISDEEMATRGLLPIHPSFRVLALAEPPVLNAQKPAWLNPELLTMFSYHYMRPLDSSEETSVLKDLVPGCDAKLLGQLLFFTQGLRSSHKNATLVSLSASLSTRQLLRIAKRIERFGSEDIHSAVHKACLSQFLPQMARGILNDHLELHDILAMDRSSTEQSAPENGQPWEKADGSLRIGRTTVALAANVNQVKVPDVLFYDNPQHTRVMEEMLKDFALGEHLLLVGNQGVGKNKLVDRFLYLLDQPREYIQLHRDTTVQSLTLQPTVRDGRILYEDSPMVVALQRGHVLVVDEADKAPTHVTCILKALVEKGEMILGDGRRVVTGGADVPADLDNVIVAHPNFRLIVLANRPGFPFLGNDFFASLGDMFSCHAIGNPDQESELAMLRQYGPDVSEDILAKLVSAFTELRGLADEGLISYPYSTREVVNIVKHLQKFHEEGLPMVVRNVFDFDRYQPELQEQLINILRKHGIPLGVGKDSVKMSKKFPLPVPTFAGRFFRSAESREVEWQEKPLSIQGGGECPATVVKLEKDQERAKRFSEKYMSFKLPMSNSSRSVSISTVKSDPSDNVYIATSSPSGVYSMSVHADTAKYFELYHFFPQLSWTQTPELSVVGLQNNVRGDVLVHEATKNELLLLNVASETVRSVHLQKEVTEEVDVDELVRSSQRQRSIGKSFVCGDFASSDIVYVYTAGSDTIDMINLLDANRQSLQLPFLIKSVVFHDSSSWLITAADDSVHSLDGDRFLPSRLTQLNAETDSKGAIPAWIGHTQSNSSSPGARSLASNERGDIIEVTNALATDRALPMEVHNLFPGPMATVPPVWLSESQLMVQVVPEAPAPVREDSDAEDEPGARPAKARTIKGRHLRVVDFKRKTARYMPLTARRGAQAAAAPYSGRTQQQQQRSHVAAAGLSSGDVLTVQSDGSVDLWQVAADTLERSLTEWQKMVGLAGNKKLQIDYKMKDGQVKPRKKGEKGEKGDQKSGVDGNGKPLTRPKHGKADAKNEPHVGGNTWAGGTGGRDTAGLGGVGGPYRLDAGHDVHQVPDEVKEAVPPEITAAARAMALKAWKEKLKEIDMGEFDALLYGKLSASVKQPVAALRIIIESLEAKQKDRSWTRHQTSGELDDNKLIEGLAGEKDIYRRRTDQDPDGQEQQKPKRLRLLVDVSGSMYRFNGVDGRLEREIQAVLMVMQSFEKHQDKFLLDIVGHSGEGETPFLNASKKNLNDRERLAVLMRMQTHTQMCMSGDSTLDATENSVKEIAKEEADEHFVIVLSDANFSRYGIQASAFSKVMTKDPKVNVFIIFIGSLGDQAVRLVQQLPSGRAFVCMDTSTLPKVLQSIFTTAILH